MASITKLLIANRAEIAARIIRTARDLDISTVAVYSDADADAPYVADADEAVRLPGFSPVDTYLRSDLLVDAAIATGAEAVHPGYGFLSERAEFATACLQAGLLFVGPSPEVIDVMGSKIGAKALMAAAGVPVLPGITIDDGGQLEDTVRDRATSRGGIPSAGQSSIRGWRTWYARRARSLRSLDRSRGGPPRGEGGLRQWFGFSGALCRYAATYRSPDLWRLARKCREPVRARVLDPTPIPEGHRGVAITDSR